MVNDDSMAINLVDDIFGGVFVCGWLNIKRIQTSGSNNDYLYSDSASFMP